MKNEGKLFVDNRTVVVETITDAVVGKSWDKVHELLLKNIYHNRIPDDDLKILSEWYEIRYELLQSRNKEIFDEKVKEFGQKLQDGTPITYEALSLISNYMIPPKN
jgi:hypothetical protein